MRAGPLTHDDLTHLLERAYISKRLDAAAKQTAALFADYMIDTDALDTPRLGIWVHDHFDAVALLSRDPERHEVRHAALFALGRSNNPRAAEPLLTALINERDFYDHDFVFMAFTALGPVALPTLLREADSKHAPRRRAALESLGSVRDVPLDALRKLAVTHGSDKAFLGTLFNQHRAELLSLAMPGLSAKTASGRLNAMSVVTECVRLTVQDDQPWPADVTRDEVIAQVALLAADAKGPRATTDPHISLWSWAVETLAMLGDVRAYDLALAVLDNPGASESARSLAPTVFEWFPERTEGWTRLREALHHDAIGTRLAAAMALVQSGTSATDVIAARDVALAVLRSERRGSNFWHEAINVIDESPGGPEAVRAWIDPKRPNSKGTRAGIAAVVELGSRGAIPETPALEQRARLDEILLPCAPAVRHLADAAWKTYCTRHRDLTYVRAPRR